MGDYWREHGDDLVQVKLIDLAGAIARMMQIEAGGWDGDVVVSDRLLTCDLPRLFAYLPPGTQAEMNHAPHPHDANLRDVLIMTNKSLGHVQIFISGLFGQLELQKELPDG